MRPVAGGSCITFSLRGLRAPAGLCSTSRSIYFLARRRDAGGFCVESGSDASLQGLFLSPCGSCNSSSNSACAGGTSRSINVSRVSAGSRRRLLSRGRRHQHERGRTCTETDKAPKLFPLGLAGRAAAGPGAVRACVHVRARGKTRLAGPVSAVAVRALRSPSRVRRRDRFFFERL